MVGGDQHQSTGKGLSCDQQVVRADRTPNRFEPASKRAGHARIGRIERDDLEPYPIEQIVHLPLRSLRWTASRWTLPTIPRFGRALEARVHEAAWRGRGVRLSAGDVAARAGTEGAWSSGRRGLAPGETLEQPFEPGHALAQVGHVAMNPGDVTAEVSQTRNDKHSERDTRADDGNDDRNRVG